MVVWLFPPSAGPRLARSAVGRAWALPALLASAASLALLSCDVPGRSNEILWDTWGVPHIYGSTEEDVLRGFGWAQARAHGDLILRLYGQARGRSAEYWGEAHLISDSWIRTMDGPGIARRWLEVQPPAARRGLEAFAEGINSYAAQHPDSLDPSVRTVLPVTAEDVLAHAVRTLHFTFIVNPTVVPTSQRALLRMEMAGAAAPEATAELPVAELVEDAGTEPPPLAGASPAWRHPPHLGSNAWAVAPERSASGNALLVANPHLPWGDLFTWFEAHLVGPGLDVTGVTFAGLPAIAIGFNDRIAWTHTVNPYDGADVFAVPLEGEGYRFDGEVRRFEIRREVLRVRQGNGRLREVPMEVRSTVHGPVIAAAGGRVAALRVAGLDAPGAVEQWWEMGRATDLEAFETRLARLQIPMFNVVYADADGRVLFLYNGRVPARSRGDVDYWAGIVPGDSSATLWTDVLDYEALPRVVDPPGGWLQNANDPPWTSTLPPVLDAADHPSWLAPRSMGFRAQRSAGMLRDDGSVTWEELLAYKHSTRMLLADRVLDDLLPVATASEDPTVRAAARVLDTWDRAADAESRGAILFLRWVREWQASSRSRGGTASGEEARGRAAVGGSGAAGDPSGPFAEPWDPDRPASTPDGIAHPEAALEALAEAARAVEEEHGSLDVAWGDVHRLRVGGWDLPGNGASGDPGGVFRVVEYAPDGGGGLRAVGGDSWVAAVELGDEVRARVLLSYGNWSRPGSPHVGDQLELFSRKRLRPAWRERSEIEANLEAREPIPGTG